MSKRQNLSTLSLAVVSLLGGACGGRSGLPVDPGPVSDASAQGEPEAAREPSCIHGSRTVGQTPMAPYSAIDKSRSMRAIVAGSTMSRWEAVSAALNTFIASPLSAGLGAGIMFFPRN